MDKQQQGYEPWGIDLHPWPPKGSSWRPGASLEINAIFSQSRRPLEWSLRRSATVPAEYEHAFVGMTEVDCSLEVLLEARARLRQDLLQRLTDKHKQFLAGLVRAEPDWSLLQCTHAADLPALRWKLANLEAFRKRRPTDFSAQADALVTGLGQVSPLL